MQCNLNRLLVLAKMLRMKARTDLPEHSFPHLSKYPSFSCDFFKQCISTAEKNNNWGNILK